MWFDDFQHGYGRCATMRCGEFPPPLLKGAGAAFGHDVAEANVCTNEDRAGSTCKMSCPDTHPVHHFAHYWQEIICHPSGYWSQPLYTYYTGYCQAPSCNYFDIIPPENGWYSCSDEGYEGSVCTFGCNSVDYKLDNKARLNRILLLRLTLLTLTLSEQIHESLQVRWLLFSILRLIKNMIRLCRKRYRKKLVENFRIFISQERLIRILIQDAYCLYFNLVFE